MVTAKQQSKNWLSRCNGGEAMATAKQQSKVKKVMHEHKYGTLKSGSGRKVKSRKQAIAIAMSESSQSRSRKKTG